jgi:hypothetical protein
MRFLMVIRTWKLAYLNAIRTIHMSKEEKGGKPKVRGGGLDNRLDFLSSSSFARWFLGRGVIDFIHKYGAEINGSIILRL